jgi:hypothetical protein
MWPSLLKQTLDVLSACAGWVEKSAFTARMGGEVLLISVGTVASTSALQTGAATRGAALLPMLSVAAVWSRSSCCADAGTAGTGSAIATYLACGLVPPNLSAAFITTKIVDLQSWFPTTSRS